MDDFKKKTLNTYGWELSYSNELGKYKLRSEDKKSIRRLSRSKLKNYDRKIINNLQYNE